MSERNAVTGPDLAIAADVLVRDYMAVRSGEAVLITTDGERDPAVVQAIANAARLADASPAVLAIPQLPFQGALADPYMHPALVAAASSCAVWIDLTFPYIAGSHVFDTAMASKKVRYLLGGDLTPGGLSRLFGKVDLDAYYAVHQAFDSITSAAIGKQVRLTNGQGSDITFTLGKPGFAKPRRADAPGLYFVPGSCTMFPEPDSVKGVLHVDAAFHEYYTPLDPPITLRLDGRIREVSGGAGERVVLDRALRRASGGDYGHVIHFTQGIHPAARVTGQSFIEDMRAIGNNAIGLGIPFWLPGGGENHPDTIMTLQSIWVAGEKIVEDGIIVGPPALAKLAEKLVPKL